MKKQDNKLSHAEVVRTVMQEYEAAFGKTYPGVNFEVQRAWTKRGEPSKFWVIIDGDRGETALSLQDMREAIAAFNK